MMNWQGKEDECIVGADSLFTAFCPPSLYQVMQLYTGYIRRNGLHNSLANVTTTERN